LTGKALIFCVFIYYLYSNYIVVCHLGMPSVGLCCNPGLRPGRFLGAGEYVYFLVAEPPDPWTIAVYSWTSTGARRGAGERREPFHSAGPVVGRIGLAV